MVPKWKRLKGRFVLKIIHKNGRNAYLLKAGSYDDGEGESRACAQTSPRIADAMGFETIKGAERMRKLLNERYGLQAQIIERQLRNRDD